MCLSVCVAYVYGPSYLVGGVACGVCAVDCHRHIPQPRSLKAMA